MSKTAINADHDQRSAHLKSFRVQCLTNQTSDNPGSYRFFTYLFTHFQAIVSVFKIALLQILSNLNHTYKTPVNLYVANFKQPFPNNCTILMLHIIPNRKLHTFNFHMEYNEAVCTVGQLNSTEIGFGRSTN